VIKANLLRPATCQRSFRGAKILIHLAYRREPYGYPDGYPPRTFDDHIRLNRHVFLEACKAGVRNIIFSSTIQVIAQQRPNGNAVLPPPYLPLDENSPAQPDNWYSLAKWCSEQMLAMLRRQYGIDYTIVRFPGLFSTVPIPHPERHASRRSEAFSYLTFRDAADVLVKTVDADLPGAHIYFPASRNNTQGRPLAEMLSEHLADVPLRKPAAELESFVDVSTLKREIGWEPMDLKLPPDPEPYIAPVWRLYKRFAERVPKSMRPAVERFLSAFE
jgi:UDP-glucose 4-epimerase